MAFSVVKGHSPVVNDFLFRCRRSDRQKDRYGKYIFFYVRRNFSTVSAHGLFHVLHPVSMQFSVLLCSKAILGQ